MNNWNAIRRFYKAWDPVLLNHRQDEWAMDPYEWDNGMIRMTHIETWLWADIRNNSAILYPQYPVGGVFVDFANPVAKVAIECDGAAYHQDKAKDEARDGRLRAMGWSVYRITGSDCRTESDEETGEPGRAYVFVRDICDHHNIRRNSIEDDDGPWIQMANSFTEEVLFSMRVRADIRNMLSREA
jgi:hypothetical protein